MIRFDSLSDSFFVAEVSENLDAELANKLGGTLKVGEIVSEVPTSDLETAYHRGKKQLRSLVKTKLLPCSLDAKVLVPQGRKNTFGVSVYIDHTRFSLMSWTLQKAIGVVFKQELAMRNQRVRFMGFPRSREFPQLTNVEVLKKNLVEESVELLACVNDRCSLLARTISNHNPFEFRKRDINRPVQRRIFSISPRLAKIMVNLSLCKSGKTLLDPFCGVGTILQEAVLTHAQVIGVDLNPWCVDASVVNLEWLKNEYKLTNVLTRIIQGDVANLPELAKTQKFDCIATEPDLGPALRCLPTRHYAKRIISKLRPLYNVFLTEAHRVLRNKGRLVLTSPYIRTRSSGFVSVDLEEKAQSTGFKAVKPFVKDSFTSNVHTTEKLPLESDLVDLEERHKIGRRILIFEK